jgi:hypothetical protein
VKKSRGTAQMSGALFYYPTQWDDDDFEPIAAAFDDLFKELGWQK